MKSVLVAGGAGFVGSHLVDRLLMRSDVERLANLGTREAIDSDPALRLGVNAVAGSITYAGVPEAFGLPCVDLAEVL